ncbi:MAG: glycosyltransferase family 2 protein [Pseudohongiellaceae bacterium]
MGTSVPIFFAGFLSGSSMGEGILDTVSVVIPSYNREHTLARALDSVMAQTWAVDEILVVDDGSTDNTESLVNTYYPTVRYIYQPNCGVSSARNKGIRLSKSHWIALLDSDDEWHKEKLELQFRALDKEREHRLVHTDEVWFRNGKQVNKTQRYRKRGGRLFEDCLELCAISPSSVLIEKTLLLEVGGFDEKLPACEDYDLWLKICCEHPTLCVNKPLLNKFGGASDQLSTIHWGLDRFRVAALNRFLCSERAEQLSQAEMNSAKLVLRKKCNILVNGALKRDNYTMARKFEALIIS